MSEETTTVEGTEFAEEDGAVLIARKPLALAFYRGVTGKLGAMRFELIPPYSSKDPAKRNKPGAVLVSAAEPLGPNKYDWENKITFALSVPDVGMVLDGIRTGKAEIFHDPNMKSDRQGETKKTFSLVKNTEKNNFAVTLSMSRGDKTTKVFIPMSNADMILIDTLLKFSIPTLLAWN